jgi:hypothetical protein
MKPFISATEVRQALAEIGCCYRCELAGQVWFLVAKFKLKRSPNQHRMFVVIARRDLPSGFGYAQFQRVRNDLVAALRCQVNLNRSPEHIVVELNRRAHETVWRGDAGVKHQMF